MKILSLYVTRSLLYYLVLAACIATFVMMAGNFAKAFEMLSAGVPPGPLGRFILYKLPKLLTYTLPMGLLVAAVMLFNRLSADNEITGLRASGVSLLQLIAAPLLFSVGLSGLCFYLHFVVGPESNHRARWLLREGGVQNPLALLEVGTFSQTFPGTIIKIDRKEDNRIYGLRLITLDPKTGKLQTDLTARAGTVSVNEAEKLLTLDLEDTMIRTVTEGEAGELRSNTMVAPRFQYPLDYGRALATRSLGRKVGDMNLAQVFGYIQLQAQLGESTTPAYTSLHLRAALALAPISFLFIGIPLGLRLSRRETSSGLVGAIVIAFFYFGAMTLVEGLHRHPALQPHLLAWVPNLLCQGGGIYALWRKR